MRSPVMVDGRKGIIIHNRLCADGPVDPETGEFLLDEDGYPYDGPNDDMAELMHEYLLKVRSSINIDQGRQVAPRFGILSLLAMHTPIYVYDHPAFKKISNTAFTDGIHVFVDADFMRKLVIQEEESNGKKSGVVFLILHELLHKLLAHVDRLKKFPPIIANIAEDLVINGKLVKGFDMISPVDLLLEVGVGMKPAEAEKYHNMTEEVVAEMLLIIERKKKEKLKEEEQKQQQKGQDNSEEPDGNEGECQNPGNNDEEGDGGNPMPGKGKGKKSSKKGQSPNNQDPNEDQDGSGNEQEAKNSSGQGEDDENENEGPEQGQGQKDEDQNGTKSKKKKASELQDGDLTEEEYADKEHSPIHHITPEELLDIIEKNGLQDTVGKALDLPSSDDVEAIGKMKDQSKYKDMDAIQIAMNQAARANGKYPGQHIAEYASDVVGNLGKGKLTWKLAAKKLTQGDGLKMAHSDDEADIPWLLDKETLGIEPFYSGALLPQINDETVVCIIDTSGSTSSDNQRTEYLQEVLGLKSGLSGSDQARKVVVFSGDSIIRGKPLEITAQNVNKIKNDGIPIFGNGGTDFASCLNQVLALPIMKKEKVKAVLYFTDCLDSPPRRQDFEDKLASGIKVAFFTTPGMWSEKWNQEVSSWAEVYCIEEGGQVNLDSEKINQNTRKNNRLK